MTILPEQNSKVLRCKENTVRRLKAAIWNAREILAEKAARRGYLSYDTTADAQNHIIQNANPVRTITIHGFAMQEMLIALQKF